MIGHIGVELYADDRQHQGDVPIQLPELLIESDMVIVQNLSAVYDSYIPVDIQPES